MPVQDPAFERIHFAPFQLVQQHLMKPHLRPPLDIFAALVLVLVLFALLVLGINGYPGGGAVDEMIGDEAPLFADAVDGLAEGCMVEVGEDCV